MRSVAVIVLQSFLPACFARTKSQTDLILIP